MAEPQHWLEFHQEGNGDLTIRPPHSAIYYIVQGIWLHETSGSQNAEFMLTDGTDEMRIMHDDQFHTNAQILLTRDWYMTIDCDAGLNVSVTVRVVGAA